jgi:Ni/Fe-hydrogenase subunit HybB-like protein
MAFFAAAAASSAILFSSAAANSSSSYRSRSNFSSSVSPVLVLEALCSGGLGGKTST